LAKAQRERRISGRAKGEVQDREKVWGDEEMAWLWQMSLPGFSQTQYSALPHLNSSKSQTDGKAFNWYKL
jgi:hypothetical protein